MYQSRIQPEFNLGYIQSARFDCVNFSFLGGGGEGGREISSCPTSPSQLVSLKLNATHAHLNSTISPSPLPVLVPTNLYNNDLSQSLLFHSAVPRYSKEQDGIRIRGPEFDPQRRRRPTRQCRRVRCQELGQRCVFLAQGAVDGHGDVDEFRRRGWWRCSRSWVGLCLRPAPLLCLVLDCLAACWTDWELKNSIAVKVCKQRDLNF